MLLKSLQGVQGDTVCCSSKLVRVTLCKEAMLPEDGQPMVHYYLRWFWLQCCSSGYEALRGVDVPLRGRGSSLQPQETAPHPLDPIVVHSEGLIPFWKEVLLLHPCRQSHFPSRRALLLLSCCPLPGRRWVWTLILQVLLPALDPFTSWCRGALRLLDGDLIFL